MDGHIENVRIEEGYGDIIESSRSDPWGPSVRRTRKIVLTVIIEEPIELPRSGDRVLVVSGKELKEFAEREAKRIRDEKADRDRMARMSDDHPGWSGCPDCGQLPCTCIIDPKLF